MVSGTSRTTAPLPIARPCRARPLQQRPRRTPGHGDLSPRTGPHRLSASYFPGRPTQRREVGCGAVCARSCILGTDSRRHPDGHAVRLTRVPMVLPQAPDQRWSPDFVSDCLAARRFRNPGGGRRLHPRVPGGRRTHSAGRGCPATSSGTTRCASNSTRLRNERARKKSSRM